MSMSKFGHAEYFAVNNKGKWIPFYPLVFVVEGATTRLLSPQDCATQFNLNNNFDTYGGSSRYFWMDVGNKHRITTHISGTHNIPFFHVRRRLPTDPPRTFTPSHVRLIKREPECDCHLASDRCTCQRELLQRSFVPIRHDSINEMNMSVLDETNQNLSSTQKAILLWHCRLGHIGFQHIVKLLSMCDTKLGTEPFNTTDCLPCLLLPSGVNKSSLTSAKPPLCSACEIANAKRRGPSIRTVVDSPSPKLILKTKYL
jgi:hypothetical protein